jgi:hypothetical protein
MKQQAQVTIFVIIGAVILLGALLLFLLNQNILENKPGLDEPDVELEARPAVNMITSCLEETGTEALKRIGSQGGTYYPPSLSYPPHRSESVDFPPMILPYWRYLDSCETNPVGCEELYQPPLCKAANRDCSGYPRGDDSIQEQVELYVEEHLDSCIANFASLSKQYDLELQGEPDVEVLFQKENTVFLLFYPILITSFSTDNTKEYDSYRASVDVRMQGMYDLAQDIVAFERKTNFYEVKTMDLISVYSGLESKLPPTSEVTFFSPRAGPWIQYEVEEILQYDLLPFMNVVRFQNTKNYLPLVEENDLDGYEVYSQGIYQGMSPPISGEDYPFNVYHHYLYQPIFLQINDGKQVILPQDLYPHKNLILKLAGLFMKDYRFKYHLSYPLVVTIEDDEALDGEGFDFNFAVEVNIRNNVPAYRNFSLVSVPVPLETSIAEPDQRLEQNISIQTFDKHTGASLGDVEIAYVCGDEYEIGMTKLTASGEALLEVNLPYCEFGGAIRYKKEGYLGESISYNNKIGGEDKEFELALWPIQQKQIIIQKRTVQHILDLDALGTNELFYRDQLAANLSANEMVLFSVERKKTSAYDTDVPLVGFIRYEQETVNFTTTNNYDQSKQIILDNLDQGYYDNETAQALLESLDQSQQEQGSVDTYQAPEIFYMDFVPGNYTIDATLITTEGVHIPADTIVITGGEDGGLGGVIGDLIVADEEINLPEQNFSMWMSGGAKLNLSMPEYYLYTDAPIIFYVLEMSIPTTWDELGEVEQLEDYQVGKEKFLRPKRD